MSFLSRFAASPVQSAGRRFRHPLLPLAFYGLGALAITWPLVARLSTHALGAGYGDEFEVIRLIWWLQHALQTGRDPFYQSLLGYPNGFYSSGQWAEPLRAWPEVPLSFLAGPVAAFNLVVLIELILNGFTAYLLCAAISQSRSAALVGGLIFMTYPAIQGQVSGGHNEVSLLFGLPLLALSLWKIVVLQGGWRWAALGAAAILVTGLGSATQIIYTILPLCLFFLGYFALFRRALLFKPEVLRRLLAMGIAGGALLVPFWVPLFGQLSSSETSPLRDVAGWVTYSTDPLAFISPSPFTPWGAAFGPAYTRAVLGTNSIEGTAYLGIFAIGLCGIALARGGKSSPESRPWPWLLVALGSMVFSLGPFLKWLDKPVIYQLGSEYKSFIVLPYAFLQNLPVFSATRTPGRFNLTTGLAVAVLASLGAAWLFRRAHRPAARAAFAFILCGAIALDNQLFFPTQTTPAAIPPVFSELASRTDIRAVFDIPWDDPLAAKEALYYQTAHQKPLIAGYVERQTPVEPAKLNVLEQIILQADLEPNVRLTALKQAGIDAVIVHRTYAEPEMIARSQAALGKPLYEDDQVVVFQVPPPAVTDERLLSFPGSGQQLDLLVPHAGWVRFEFAGPSTPLSIGARRIGISGPGRPSAVTVRLASGTYTVDWPAADERSSTADRTAPRVAYLDSTDPFQAVAVELAEGFELQGYGIESRRSQVNVDLVWHAAQKPGKDYHLFVHLLDPAGHLAAQFDSRPGAGTFPTDQWPADQTWSETVALDTAAVPSGDYELYAGWYSYPDLIRLPVHSPGPHSQDGLIFLGRVSIGKP